MTRAIQTTLAILVALVLLAASGAFYVLEEGEQAVLLQFGRPVGAPATDAGLHFKVPFIQEVRRFDKRLLIWDGDPNQIPTAGREFIWVFDFTLGTHPITTKGTSGLGGAKRRSALGLCLHKAA